MLYDHQSDPGEDINISERPKNKDVVRNLAKELQHRMGKDKVTGTKK